MNAEEFKSSIAGLASEVERNEYYQKLIYVPSDNDVKTGKTEDKGWVAGASIKNLWNEYLNQVLGVEEQ